MALSAKKINKKAVNNLTNFLGKNNDDIKYSINNSMIRTTTIFHQVSGELNQIKTAQIPVVIEVVSSFFIKVFLCICCCKFNYFQL